MRRRSSRRSIREGAWSENVDEYRRHLERAYETAKRMDPDGRNRDIQKAIASIRSAYRRLSGGHRLT